MILQNNRRHVRLKEKGGKQHVMPCHHELEDYLMAYVEAAGLREDATSPLFRAVDNRTRSLGTVALSHPAHKLRPGRQPGGAVVADCAAFPSNFVSGAGAVCGLTPADTFTAKQLAELCGRTTVAVPGRGGDRMQGSGLALYDDLLRMAPGELLVFLRGHEPPLPGVPNPFKGYAPPYFEPGSRFSAGLDPRPIAVG